MLGTIDGVDGADMWMKVRVWAVFSCDQEVDVVLISRLGVDQDARLLRAHGWMLNIG